MIDDSVTVLSEDESWHRLGSVALGRLVTTFADEPGIFQSISWCKAAPCCFVPREGAKLFSAVAKCAVAFEADDHNVAEGWSVIVKVRAQVLTTDAGVREAERAQLLPWTATLKRHCVRVIPWEITGRHFRFGPEPDRSQTFACEASSHNQR